MKYIIFSLALMFLLPPAAGAQKIVKGNYHDQLLQSCEDKAGRECCRASVHAMRDEQARIYDKQQGCAYGTKPVSLRCPASYTWCSFKTREDLEDR